jgi:polysaccharide export outer membrane protein
MKNALILLIIVGMAFASCRNQKELIYFPGLEEETIQNPTPQDVKDYRIQISDILYIRLLSSDEKISTFFENASGMTGQQNNMMYQEAGIYYSGYSVDKDGEIELPQIGKVKIEGLTIDEAGLVIREEVDNSLPGTKVIVKLANQKFTLLGEVKSPGTYVNYNNQTTILEGIALAGDLTDYGDRKNVLVIRPTGEGVTSHRLDLNNKDILSSPYYYLKPNDVVYVQPLKAKGTRMFSQDYGVFISIISSTLATASVVLTLILNLKK